MVRHYQLLESEKVFRKADLKAKQGFLEVDTYAEVGAPAECIIEFARKAKCDEIVMGSRGLGGILLGSVVSKVVRMSPVPVVVVK